MTQSVSIPERAREIAPKEKRSARVNWLRNHPDKATSLTRLEIIKELKANKLLSEKTQPIDVNLFNLMRDAGYSRRTCIRFSRAPHFYRS